MARGGAREGAGRPKKAPEDRKVRPQKQMRAWPEEWELIKRFAKLVKKDMEKAKRILDEKEQ